MIRTATTAVLALGVIGCTAYSVREPVGQLGRSQAAEAQRLAAARCAPYGVTQLNRTDGTSTADYDCERPSK